MSTKPSGLEQISSSPVQTETEVDARVQQLDSALAAKVLPTTRIVKLNYKSCCGCGCSNYKITREVPYDSPLQDGDQVTNSHASDQDGWKRKT